MEFVVFERDGRVVEIPKELAEKVKFNKDALHDVVFKGPNGLHSALTRYSETLDVSILNSIAYAVLSVMVVAATHLADEPVGVLCTMITALPVDKAFGIVRNFIDNVLSVSGTDGVYYALYVVVDDIANKCHVKGRGVVSLN